MTKCNLILKYPNHYNSHSMIAEKPSNHSISILLKSTKPLMLLLFFFQLHIITQNIIYDRYLPTRK